MDEMRVNLAALKLIIIDEMSLVSADNLYRIHQRLCDIFQNKKIFGGISIMLVGDLLQLPPVCATAIFKIPTHPSHQVLFHEESLWHSAFEVVNLVHNHRQGEGSKWADVLNKFRDGTFSEEDVKILEERIIKDVNIPELEDACHVFYRNEDVADRNKRKLNLLQNVDLFEIKAVMKMHVSCRPCIKVHGTVGDTNMMEYLKIKVGARVMMIVNVDTSDKLVNGTLGTIIDIVKHENSEDVKCVIISYDNSEAGRKQREKHPHLAAKYKSSNGTPLFKHNVNYEMPSKSKGKSHAAMGTVTQFPIRLAWANTAHKLQVFCKN